MEELSVSSPRRILSLSRRKRAKVLLTDSDDKATAASSSGLGFSGERGPKSSEVYGFVGSITTVVATVVLLIWAYVPESWLHLIGIYYYPSKYWAVAVPTYFMMTVVLGLLFYIALNFISTPPPTSMDTIFDEFSREPLSFVPETEGCDRPIDPIYDISIDKINESMFKDAK